MVNSVIDKAQQLIAPIIEDLGYEVVDIEYKNIHNQMNLTFYIYKLGGISLVDCEKVNNALSIPLDEFDITNGSPYVLNISSPGLDRPIKSDDDLRRSLNTDVDAKLIDSINKEKRFIGELVKYDSTTITIKADEEFIIIERTNIKILVPYIKF